MVVVIGLAALAVDHVRGTSAQSEASPVTASPSIGVSSSRPTAAGTPSNNASQTPASPTPKKASDVMAQIRRALSGDQSATVLVLGDGTGGEQYGWVSTWAHKYLGSKFRVQYHEWNAQTDGFRDQSNFGDGDKQLRLWNASIPGATSKAVEGRLADLLDAVGQPDVVVLSFGHTEQADQVGDGLRSVWKRVNVAAGLVVIQNPEKGPRGSAPQRETAHAVQSWAKRTDLPTVNVYQAFVEDPAPLKDLLESDGVIPSEAGSELWARIVNGRIASR